MQGGTSLPFQRRKDITVPIGFGRKLTQPIDVVHDARRRTVQLLPVLDEKLPVPDGIQCKLTVRLTEWAMVSLVTGQ